MTRLSKSIKNVKYSYLGNIVILILQFVSRTIFIKYIGLTYLGLEGVFSNVLGVLSFAELGIGTSINFSLYKPVAENDTEKTKSLLIFYKKAYYLIALVVLVIGIGLVPFLHLFAAPEGIDNYYLIYFIYLFNSVTSYLVSYKFSIVNANQDNYIETNIMTVTRILLSFTQIIVLVITKNFLAYLLVGLVINLMQKFFIKYYLDKRYPILTELKYAEKIDSKELSIINKNVKSLILHKVGEMSVYQTDNIIISALLGIQSAGLLANYNMIINAVSTFTNALFNSVNASFGNMIATENSEYHYNVFKKYRFLAFWVYSFCAICLFILLNPFITLWFGEDYTFSILTVFVLCLNFYFLGNRICLTNLKNAAGLFYHDRYLPLIQSVVNIVLSIVLTLKFGIVGVFIGTLVQGLLANIVRSYIVYKYIFKKSVLEYYKESLKYLLIMSIVVIMLCAIKQYIIVDISILRFVVLIVLTVIIINFIYLFIFNKKEEFKYYYNLLKKKAFKKFK